MYKDILGKKCIVRSYDAGVYFGTVTNVEGETVRVEVHPAFPRLQMMASKMER